MTLICAGLMHVVRVIELRQRPRDQGRGPTCRLLLWRMTSPRRKFALKEAVALGASTSSKATSRRCVQASMAVILLQSLRFIRAGCVAVWISFSLRMDTV
jgi:hypothetical protein